MKKGKTSKIVGLKNVKIQYGTVDSISFKSMYLNIQTWVEPIVDSDNWNRVVLNLSRSIKHTLYENIDKKIFNENFIVDLDLRSSGLSVGKKSFLNLEINLFLNEDKVDFKSKDLKNSLKILSKILIDENFKKNKYFKFHLRKTLKNKELESI